MKSTLIHSDITISIIVPNWNGRKLLEKHLPSIIAAKNIAKNKIIEIIVVDDGSTDDSVSYLKTLKRDIRIVQHTKNRGFSSAVNTGVRSCRSPIFCLLNTDVSVDKNFLISVIPHFENELVFGVSLHEKGFGPATAKFQNGYIIHKGLAESKHAVNTFWVSGGSGVFRRSIWMELRGLDETLLSPFYWEDVDICYRASKRGYLMLWEPSANVVHQHESVINTNTFKKKYMDIVKERNQLLVIWKNITSGALFWKHINGMIMRTIKHPGYIRVIIAAYKKRKEVIIARKRERKEAIVSDEAVFAKFMNFR